MKYFEMVVYYLSNPVIFFNVVEKFFDKMNGTPFDDDDDYYLQ